MSISIPTSSKLIKASLCSLAVAGLLLATSPVPTAQAGILGGGIGGALLGGLIGGRGGAIMGGIMGATVGAASMASRNRRYHQQMHRGRTGMRRGNTDQRRRY